MEGLIDIHIHILPEIDDGANNMEQTLKMIQIAYDEGIRTIIATPHFKEDRYTSSRTEIKEILQRVQEVVHKKYPDLRIMFGNEVFYSEESVSLLKQKIISTMAGSKLVLVEFLPMTDYSYIKNGLQAFLMEGYQPILAHVERYANLTKDLNRIEELMELGVELQVNASSIMGDGERQEKKFARRMLKYGYASFVATDAHSDGRRAPRLKKCADYIAKKFGEEYMRELLIENPKNLILSDQQK